VAINAPKELDKVLPVPENETDRPERPERQDFVDEQWW